MEPITAVGRFHIDQVIRLNATDHFVQAISLARRCCQLGPHFHPLAGLSINLLLAHLECDLLNESVSDRVRVR